MISYSSPRYDFMQDSRPRSSSFHCQRPASPAATTAASTTSSKLSAMRQTQQQQHKAGAHQLQTSPTSTASTSSSCPSCSGSSEDLRQLQHQGGPGAASTTSSNSSSNSTSPVKTGRKMGRRHSEGGMRTPDERVAYGEQERRDAEGDGAMRPARRKVNRTEQEQEGEAVVGAGQRPYFPAPPNQQRPQPQDEAPTCLPSMDIVNFPTATLLHLLAVLLGRITAHNDVARQQPSSSSGTVTPPPSARGPAAGGQRISSQPVTPAVPFSSPVVQPAPAAACPLSPFTPATSSSVAHQAPAQASRDRPRHNFSSPDNDFLNANIKQHTLLTSAAAAYQTPNATLCFHARNVPSISIESYLTRISKYCPTTNEVFISLLAYFDRMSRLPNFAAAATQSLSQHLPSSTPPDASQLFQHFAVDSFNIHRLIISGITVASKFFSDVFYTNSRYAKVGGLPLPELNALELQFLLLNGFDLIVTPEEIQTYADYLLVGSLPPESVTTFPQASYLAQTLPKQSLPAPGASAPQNAIKLSSVPMTTPETVSNGSAKPKYNFRSASESSTSASETSTVVPSEESASTQRMASDHEAEPERTLDEDGDEEMDTYKRMHSNDPFIRTVPAPEPTRREATPKTRSSTRLSKQRRENSRTREWTMSQQVQQPGCHDSNGDGDTEMADPTSVAA